VYAGGISTNENREFDFSGAPVMDHWRFGDDPNVPDQNGLFLEVPITALRVSPLFWYRGEFRKRLSPGRFARFGDGEALSNNTSYYADRLLKRSVIPVSVDQYRAQTLYMAHEQGRRSGLNMINSMGHPKAMTRDSLETLDRFLKERAVEPVHFSDLARENGAGDGG
jgi:hypothetical protein